METVPLRNLFSEIRKIVRFWEVYVHVRINKIQKRGESIDGYHDIGATMRQISLIHHHAFTQIGSAVLPIVVHRDQNIREYSTIDYRSVSLESSLRDNQTKSKNHRSSDR